MKTDTESFNALIICAKIGTSLIIFTRKPNGINETYGILKQINETGIIIESETKIEWIKSTEIESWQLNKSIQNKSTELEAHTELKQSSPPITLAREPIANDVLDQENKNLNSQNQESQRQNLDLQLFFAGEPNLPILDPVFNFPSIPKENQNDVNKWKQHYEYAKKVKEPGRCIQDIPKIADLAETLNNQSLYYLSGILSIFCGLGNQRSITYFEKALEINGKFQDASLAMASLYIKDLNWKKASDLILWSVHLDGKADKEELVRTLGQCVVKIKDASLPPIGFLLNLDLPKNSNTLAKYLIGLMVKENPEAYDAAINGNIDLLRKTKIGNDLFPWGDSLTPPVDEKIPVPKTLKKEPKTETNNQIRKGKISAYYPDKAFGFLVENSTGMTWFFHNSSFSSSSTGITKSLNANVVDQEVKFIGSPIPTRGNYPLAQNIELFVDELPESEKLIGRAPLPIRLKAVPNDNSFFAKAMYYEQIDRLDNAEANYHKEITTNGINFKSAIKNWAALLNKKGNPQSAIDLLEKYKNKFSVDDQLGLTHLKVVFNLKAKNYEKSAELLGSICKQVNDNTKKLIYRRQQAYCYLVSGLFPKAIELLESIIKTNPHDYESIKLLGKSRQALETGTFVQDSDDSYLPSTVLELSKLAKYQLETCDLRGIDSRTRESSKFTKSDILGVQNLLAGVKGRRPKEKSDYLLTLAKVNKWLSENTTHVSDDNTNVYLRRHFVALAEAAMTDGNIDAGRCYAIESLTHCPNSLSIRPGVEYSEPQTSFITAFTLLIGSYLYENNNISDLIYNEGLSTINKSCLPKVLKDIQTNKTNLDSFLQDAPFYFLKARTAFLKLLNIFNADIQNPNLWDQNNKNLNRSINLEKYNILETALRIDSFDFSADKLRNTQEAISDSIKSIFFETDKKVILDLKKALGNASNYLLEAKFKEKETKFLSLLSELSNIDGDTKRYSTYLFIEKIKPIVSELKRYVEEDFEKCCIKKPKLDLRNVLGNDFYTILNNQIALKIEIISINPDSPPIEAISLVIDKELSPCSFEPCHSPEPLNGGESREIEIIVNPSENQIKDGVFTVSIFIEYRNKKGSSEKSDVYFLPIRLGDHKFERIENPYIRYAAGTPVDKDMFFGRSDLMGKACQIMTTGEQGQCFVLYGQKRSGKSSVIQNIENQIKDSVIFIRTPAGTFSPGNLWGSFASQLIQQMFFWREDNLKPVNKDFPDCDLVSIEEKIKKDWPNDSYISNYPTESIKLACRLLKNLNKMIVVAVDEFTYLFENQEDDLQTFMRGWKALLESKTFSAIIVGQDTMPRFKKAFPNEFGMTFDYRINYLSEEESADLASKPILLNNQSRFRGKALKRLFNLTAGSPFFLQIACDRIVRYLNSKESSFVTEADIDSIRTELTNGSSALTSEKFDALVTAAGEKVALIKKDVLWNVLEKIAKDSVQLGWCTRDQLKEIHGIAEILDDLRDRDIIKINDNKVSIRVELFSYWIRANL